MKQAEQGSPFAVGLDRRLKSDEPLSSVVNWWSERYREWRPTLDAEGVEGSARSRIAR
jgi:hypothetical protein